MKRLSCFRMSLVGLCLTLSLAFCPAKAEMALFWQFADSPITAKDGTTVKASELSWQDLTVNGIRVKATSGEVSQYLNLYGGSGTDLEPLGDFLYMDSDTGWIVDPLMAGLGVDYARNGVSFSIELGNLDFDTEAWTALACSSPEDYENLRLGEMIVEMTADVAIPALPWTGGDYSTVPEPTGGLLTLVGVAALALRRRRGVAA